MSIFNYAMKIDICSMLVNLIISSFHRLKVPIHSGQVHLGGGDKTVPKRLEDCSMDMLPHMVN